MVGKEEQVHRILMLYDLFRQGEVVNKVELANELDVNSRTIQRDIQNIRRYLDKSLVHQTIEYDRSINGYVLHGEKEGICSKTLLTITKVLLESRALNNDEMKIVVDSLLTQSTKEDRKLINAIVGNEWLHYRPLQHDKQLLDMLWEIAESIHKKRVLEIVYERLDQKQHKRIIKPIALLFSEYYFYLIAFMNNSDYATPVIFRLDRILSLKTLKQRFTFTEKERVEDGLLRQRIQFMYSGELEYLRFIFKGHSPDVALDRFPNGRVIKTLEDGWVIEAEIYGTTGSMMWLLSQGERVEVLQPVHLRNQMKEMISEMMKIYKE